MLVLGQEISIKIQLGKDFKPNEKLGPKNISCSYVMVLGGGKVWLIEGFAPREMGGKSPSPPLPSPSPL